MQKQRTSHSGQQTWQCLDNWESVCENICLQRDIPQFIKRQFWKYWDDKELNKETNLWIHTQKIPDFYVAWNNRNLQKVL